MRARDSFGIVTLGAIWGGAYALLRFATPAFGPLALAALRLAIAALVLVALAGPRRLLRAPLARLLFLGVVNTAAPLVLFSFATLSITAGLAALLNATTPMFGAVIAYSWLGDRLTPLRILGVAVGFAGVASLVGSSVGIHASGAPLGILAGLAASASYGFAANYTKRFLLGVEPLLMAAGSVCAAALLLAPLGVMFHPARNPAAAAWLAMLGLALVCTAGGYVLFFRLLKSVGPVRSISATFLIPVFGIFWGAVFLDERVTAAMLAGCAVVLFGTALATGVLGVRVRASA
jgi:drug/metabolite transporter (DMT)-like permease